MRAKRRAAGPPLAQSAAMRATRRPAAILVALLVIALALGATARADFPGPAPPAGEQPESPRVNTPNDPNFDRCEADDEDTPERECTSYFNEQFGLFGFRPDSAVNALLQPVQYADCDQLDAQGRAANVAAGDPECSQLSGVRADTAWKYSTGRPDVAVAILDTGIRWQETELVDKVRLNAAELPEPERAGPPLRKDLDCGTYAAGDDANGDGAFSVADFACDPRVAIAGGDTEADKLLDASDLIARFSDKTDADGNGFVDDIAGWDFFDDDNDPFDASSCCNAEGHGTGRAVEAVSATDNAEKGAGLCPRCQVIPLRVWDSFVVDTNLYALATVYAADNGASVVEGAVGGLLNTSFARRAFRYADAKGVALTLVSSDINSANHNYPTNYEEAMYVSGSLPDSAPGERCEIAGFPGVGNPTGVGNIPGCKAFLSVLEGAGVPAVSGQPPTTSFFRNSNLTQYGGKNDFVLVGATGSVNTGQASGAAALLQSYARERFAGQDAFPKSLTGNEIRQLLTMSAEDVLPANTGSIGLADRAEKGWDTHFGYGRVNLAGAMRMIQAGRIPPEVQIDTPTWFTPLNVDKVPADGVAVTGRVRTPHFDGAVAWELGYACGQEGDRFEVIASGTGEVEGEVARLSKPLLEKLADDCDGSVADDPGRPAGRPTDVWPRDPYPDPDPERHAFQIKLTAKEVADPANVGMYRKTLFAHRDDGTLAGWPRPLGEEMTGGESSPRLVDLDADDRLDVLLPTSSGELHALRANGTPLPSFNGGRPVRTETYATAAAHATAGGLGEGVLAELPREPLRVPAIGDVTGDGDPEILVTAGERLYGWARDGTPLPGFPVGVDPALSEPCVAGVAKPCFDEDKRFLTPDLHLKRGFFGSPALADLDADGRLDVVVGAADQHLYAWRGDGRLLSGFPTRLDSGKASDGAEIVASPAIAELDGTPGAEVVIPTNEVLGARRQPPDELNPNDLLDLFVSAATGSTPVYAVDGDGSRVPGWPIEIGVLAGDVLPLVVPSQDAAVADVDGDGRDEVSVSAATGGARLVAADGSTIKSFQQVPGPDAQLTDRGPQLNLAENAAIGRLAAGDPLAVIKGGLSLNGVANLLAVNQNLPFNHAVQAWSLGTNRSDPRAGTYLPGYPVATDDYQLLSQAAVAKVDGAGGGRQALVGTALYQLHAYGALGAEPKGWPKFLGGWIQSTPAVGDVDGDGRLDVLAFTREGWSFAWGTEAPACSADGNATNEEWWTFHHDEHGTAKYGHDARPPSRPGPLTVERLPGRDLRVSFDAAGDDLLCGRAAKYEVAGAAQAIDDGAEFSAGTRLEVAQRARARTARRTRRARVRARAAQAPPAERVTLTIPDGARFAHVAVRAVDDAGNRGYVRNQTGGATIQPGAEPDRPRRLSPRRRTTRRSGDDNDGDDGGSLPFTGLAVGLVALLGLLLLVTGLALRRRRAA